MDGPVAAEVMHHAQGIAYGATLAIGKKARSGRETDGFTAGAAVGLRGYGLLHSVSQPQKRGRCGEELDLNVALKAATLRRVAIDGAVTVAATAPSHGPGEKRHEAVL
jgi:hypothetical protein